MRGRAVPGEERPGAQEIGEPVGVSESAGDEEDGRGKFCSAIQSGARKRPRRKRMSNRFHKDQRRSAFSGTSSVMARGTMRNSTGNPPSGSPST